MYLVMMLYSAIMANYDFSLYFLYWYLSSSRALTFSAYFYYSDSERLRWTISSSSL